MDNKVVEAEQLIDKYCSRVGSYVETGELSLYIQDFIEDLKRKRNITGFGGRVTQPLIAALLLIVNEQLSSALPSDGNDFDHILAGGAALSAMYLMARLENLFRIKSRYLNENGALKRELPTQLKKKMIKEFHINNIKSEWRCNRINQAFYIFLYRNKTLLGKRLKIMDKKLKIADRLDKIRNPAMHGDLKDPSSEARFLGLIVAMFYYGSEPTPNKKAP